MKPVSPVAVLSLMVYCLIVRVLPYVLFNLGLEIDQLSYYPWGVTPAYAFCLFNVAQLRDRRMALGIPFLMWIIGDVLIGMSKGIKLGLGEGFMSSVYPGQIYTYIALALVCGLGLVIRRSHQWPKSLHWLSILLGAIASPAIFFLLTNYASWETDPLNIYSNDLAGLQEAYIAGLPFVGKEFLSTLGFCAVFFSPPFLNWAAEGRHSSAATSSQPAAARVAERRHDG